MDDETSKRITLLIRLDSKDLFERITTRKREYLSEFALKRERVHFKEIFASRYDEAGLKELKHCSQELIVAIHDFYKIVEEMRWYLNHTQDMPNTVDDSLGVWIRKLTPAYDLLKVYLDAELDLGENSDL